jgi:hypothetical protein
VNLESHLVLLTKFDLLGAHLVRYLEADIIDDPFGPEDLQKKSKRCKGYRARNAPPESS